MVNKMFNLYEEQPDVEVTQKLISETLALSEKATPGPWRAGGDEGWPVGSFSTGNSGIDGKDYTVWTEPMSGSDMMDSGADCDAKTDAEAIAAYRTSAPKLALIAKVFLEALKLSPQGCNNSGMYGPLGISPGECVNSKYACVPCRQRAAIAEVAKIAGQE